MVDLGLKPQIGTKFPLIVPRVVKKIGTMSKARHKAIFVPSTSEDKTLELKDSCPTKLLPHSARIERPDGSEFESLYLKGNNSDFHPCMGSLRCDGRTD